MLAVSRTQPFRALQAGIGLATYRLNTVVVGLELVARGGKKPPDLAVNWEDPKSDALARQVANQAKSFALVAAMVYGTDLFDSYLRNIVREVWLNFNPDTAAIAQRAKTGPCGHEYSMMERANALVVDLKQEARPLPAMIDLLSKWRNSLVHAGAPRPIAPDARGQLVDAADELYRNYSNIDIMRSIDTFEAGGHPSRKDTTVLLAACQNLARVIDQSAIQRALPSQEATEGFARALLSERWRKSDNSLSGWREFCVLWENSPTDREKGLAKVLAQMGISKSASPISPTLPEDFLATLASLERFRVEQELSLLE